MYAIDEEEKTKLEDFEVRKLIGKGNYAKVFLVENVKTGGLYAMKVIRKDVILGED